MGSSCIITPAGGAPAHIETTADPDGRAAAQDGHRVVYWSPNSGEECVLWDLDNRVGVEHPWGLDQARIAEIDMAVAENSFDR